MQQKETLAKSEEELNEEEVKIRADVEAADELLKEATAKLNSALETKLLNKQSVTVDQMMLETATTKRENAMEQLDKIWNKQKSLDKTTQNFWMKLYTEKEKQMMLETATTKRENAMEQLDKIWNKQKSLDKTTQNFWMKLYTEKENQIREGKQQQNKDVRRKSKSEK